MRWAFRLAQTMQRNRDGASPHKQPTVVRRWVILLVLVLVGALATGDQPAQAQTGSPAVDRREGLTRALKATVLVLALDNNGDLVTNGSGTVLDAEKGILLTNYHVMGVRETQQLHSELGLAVIGVMPPDLKGAPILKFMAHVVAADSELDLAVLQISGLFDDPRAGLPANLGLTAVPRADSDELMIGDTLYVIGYPGLGGNTVTMSAGLVSGFLDEENDGLFEWIKTDAEVNRGNSGGLAVNEQWQFIGVPSRGFSEIETAGKISLIRTGNVALRFYDAALMRQATSTAQDGPLISDVTFGSVLNRGNEVADSQTHFASGVTQLYAWFVYAGFRNGAEFQTVWYRDRRQIGVDRFAWDEGESGRSWVTLHEVGGLVDGLYELELLLANQALYRGSVTVGTTARPACRFGEITFASNIGDGGQPVGAGRRFGSQPIIYASFPVTNISNGVPWQAIWYYEGHRIVERAKFWDAGPVSSQWVSLAQADGLPAGRYRLELYCNSLLQQQDEFEIVAGVNSVVAGVSVAGVISDRDNKRLPVEGALVVLLRPGVSLSAWADAGYNRALIHGSGVSDRNGAYRLDAQVAPGSSYSLVVTQDRYATIQQDGYTIPAAAADPHVLNILMRQK
jgi:S1-C subfamily serine protease